MRRVEIAVRNATVPVRRVEWQQVKDSIRAQWASMNRRPFTGPVAVGYEWRLVNPPPTVILAYLWPRILGCVSEIVSNGQAYIGVCRFTKDIGSRLIVTVEGQ